MMSKKFVKIMCIILAILMLGSVMVVALQAFAISPEMMGIVALVMPLAIKCFGF